jgi:hypothetical protein
MKVLHYTVFKGQRSRALESHPIAYLGAGEPASECESSLEVVPSKLSSTADSIDELYSSSIGPLHLLRRSGRNELEKVHAGDPQPSLSHNWPVDSWMSSIVCGRLKYVYVIAFPATGEPMTCTP